MQTECGPEIASPNSIYVSTREDLESLVLHHAADINLPPTDILLRSDKLVGFAETGMGRSPNLSAINGAEFVRGVQKKSIHEYVYSDQFNTYANQIHEQTDDICSLERHFFTYGIEIGLWLKAIQEQT